MPLPPPILSDLASAPPPPYHSPPCMDFPANSATEWVSSYIPFVTRVYWPAVDLDRRWLSFPGPQLRPAVALPESAIPASWTGMENDIFNGSFLNFSQSNMILDPTFGSFLQSGIPGNNIHRQMFAGNLFVSAVQDTTTADVYLTSSEASPFSGTSFSRTFTQIGNDSFNRCIANVGLREHFSGTSLSATSLANLLSSTTCVPENSTGEDMIVTSSLAASPHCNFGSPSDINLMWNQSKLLGHQVPLGKTFSVVQPSYHIKKSSLPGWNCHDPNWNFCHAYGNPTPAPGSELSLSVGSCQPCGPCLTNAGNIADQCSEISCSLNNDQCSDVHLIMFYLPLGSSSSQMYMNAYSVMPKFDCLDGTTNLLLQHTVLWKVAGKLIMPKPKGSTSKIKKAPSSGLKWSFSPGTNLLSGGAAKLEKESRQKLNEFSKELRTFRSVDLSSRNFGDNGLFFLAESLGYNQAAEEVDFSGNGIIAVGLKALDGVLQTNTMLKTLNLLGNNIGDEGAKPVFPQIELLLDDLFTNLKYSRVEIDEVRFEWAECMLDYI
ncbi:hypothetical protein ZIOFF_054489 [Zingiber officinale]|uniref:Uncharacterized protein n=1 Tax=Zingiber officinale TaxID=94328 RepID=A0A8J5FEJ5_ZINOF|nr:hypothetical protein ZIOFF_054489 [Zingiber officinale]